MSFLYTAVVFVVIFGFLSYLNRSRGAKVETTEHEYFHRLWLWPDGEHTRWEAEFDTASEFSDGGVGLFAEDNYVTCKSAEPTEQEILFSKRFLGDLSKLYPLAKGGLEQGWREWFKEELPQDWENEFRVDGFSVPMNGDVNERWGVTFFSKKAGHYFSVTIEGEIAKLESIDG